MHCVNCHSEIALLKSVDSEAVWLHKPGDADASPYLHCKTLFVAEPDTIGNWASRLLNSKQ